MANGNRSGLGRGLAALIPVAEDIEERYLDKTDRLLRSLTNAGFDLLEEGSDLGLCAYLHAPHDAEPHFYVRAPAWDTLSPSRAFVLCHTVAMLTNSGKDTGEFTWEGLRGYFVRSTGPESDGLHVIARTSGRMDHGSRQITREICRAFASLTHQVQHGRADEIVAPRLQVEIVDGVTRVEATVTLADGCARTGRGEATDRREAVARAVLDAASPESRFIDVRNLTLEDRRGSLVVLLDGNDSLRLGITMVTDDVMSAAAIATLRGLGQA